MPNQATDILYSRVRARGQWGQVWSTLTGRSCRLLALDEIEATCTVHTCRYAGIRAVPISQIRGSNGRSSDFDCDFNPLQDHNKQRWLHIAAARRRGKALPPVGLVQVEDVHFVCDGHHRISVARAIGQQDIEAKVMVWQVTGPLPWETSATARRPFNVLSSAAEYTFGNSVIRLRDSLRSIPERICIVQHRKGGASISRKTAA